MAKLAIPRPAVRYERRLILFIDFLGFKEVVAATESDEAALKRLIDALDAIGGMGDGGGFASQRMTQFSDSIALSYAADEESGAFWMINEIALTVISLVLHGYLVRGAVTVGPLYHEGRHVVGPAMVNAAEMEKAACTPRVVVDAAVIELAREFRRDGHTPEEEEDYVRSFVVEDEDGQLFIDYVGWDAVVAGVGFDDEWYPEYLSRLSGMIRAGLLHDDTKVVEKYLWLQPRYAAVLERFNAMGKDHPYRAEAQENCDAIESLPDLETEAAAARRRVEAAKARRTN